MALCYHAVRCIICLKVPLSSNQGSLGGQGVVLAHLAATALRATIASGPTRDPCFPAVQVDIWTLITCPPNPHVAVWFDVNGTQVSIGSMVPLLL